VLQTLTTPGTGLAREKEIYQRTLSHNTAHRHGTNWRALALTQVHQKNSGAGRRAPTTQRGHQKEIHESSPVPCRARCAPRSRLFFFPCAWPLIVLPRSCLCRWGPCVLLSFSHPSFDVWRVAPPRSTCGALATRSAVGNRYTQGRGAKKHSAGRMIGIGLRAQESPDP